MSDANNTCKKCGRKITWARMPSGAVTPFVKVTVYAIADGIAIKAISAPVMGGHVSVVSDSYISHYVDCPNAGEFGKNKKP